MYSSLICINTHIPKEFVDLIERETEIFNSCLQDSTTGLGEGVIDEKKRRSKNSWISSTSWVCGFLSHYVQKANITNFSYDIDPYIETIQYTVYNEGDYYGWHSDDSPSDLSSFEPTISDSTKELEEQSFHNHLKRETERVRKLSYSLLLSDSDEYEGGNFQFMTTSNELKVAPRTRGTLILFDARVPHRVLKVRNGTRKSLVGWVRGPRWK